MPEEKGKILSVQEQSKMLTEEETKKKTFRSQAVELRKQSKNPFSSERKMARKLSKDAKISENNVKEIKKIGAGGYAKIRKTKSGRNSMIKAWNDKE